MSRGWAKASAVRLQITLSCAVLCHIVSLQYLSRSSLHSLAGRVLGRILKVGAQNLRQGVQVQWTTISDVSVGRVCHVAGQFCAVAI